MISKNYMLNAKYLLLKFQGTMLLLNKEMEFNTKLEMLLFFRRFGIKEDK